MSLFAFPNELLEQIINEVTGDDLENLAATCKLIRALAGPMLKEHYKLKTKYDYKINYPGRRPLHPAEILDAIIEYPRAATYVKALSLTYRPSLEWYGHSPAALHKQSGRTAALLAKHDFFWNLLLNNPFIPDGEVGSWYTRIREGHLDALFALLIYYLHNLQELRIDRPILLPLTFVMISRLKSSIGHKALQELSYSSLNGDTLPQCRNGGQKLGLAKLQQVIVDPATNPSDAHRRNRLADFARLASFASFPEIQSLHGISLCSRKYNLNQSFSGFSKLRTIRLVNCNVAPESFHSLLSGIEGLQSFHYAPTDDVKELAQVVDDLKKYAGHSLTKLYLRHNEIETRSEAWKYRGFEKLRMIDLDWRCLVHHQDPTTTSANISQPTIPTIASGPPPSPKKAVKQDQKIQHPLLVDMMPSSIESIKIVDLDGKASLEDIRWLFFKLSMRLGRFPNLKVVIFVTPRQDCWTHAKSICSRAGLKYPTYSCDKERRISRLDFVYE